MPSSVISTLSLHDALPIWCPPPMELGTGAADASCPYECPRCAREHDGRDQRHAPSSVREAPGDQCPCDEGEAEVGDRRDIEQDRKSTRLNSSHSQISYAVFRDLHSFPTRRSSDLVSTANGTRNWCRRRQLSVRVSTVRTRARWPRPATRAEFRPRGAG